MVLPSCVAREPWGFATSPYCRAHPGRMATRRDLLARSDGSASTTLIVFGEAQLRRTLLMFAAYYNESRTHRSLNKDAPFHRAIESLGTIISQPLLGGLHQPVL